MIIYDTKCHLCKFCGPSTVSQTRHCCSISRISTSYVNNLHLHTWNAQVPHVDLSTIRQAMDRKITIANSVNLETTKAAKKFQCTCVCPTSTGTWRPYSATERLRKRWLGLENKQQTTVQNKWQKAKKKLERCSNQWLDPAPYECDKLTDRWKNRTATLPVLQQHCGVFMMKRQDSAYKF